MKYNSRIREQIKMIVQDSCTHPTAEEVYQTMLSKNINTSLSTVYRNLHQLAEDGVILELTLPSGKVHYDKTTINHQHAFCINCRKVYDLMIDNSDISNLIYQQIKMKVLNSQLLIKGICEECEANND